MKFLRRNLIKFPGWVASLVMIFFTGFWTYWGTAEMYHEGWWGPWYNRLPYLAPVALTLLPTLLAFQLPLVGGVLILAVGIFAFFMFSGEVAFIGLAIGLVGLAFIADGLIKRRNARSASPTVLPRRWLDWRRVLLLGAVLLIFIGISAARLPLVLSRVDDGDRSARLIAGNGVALIWAPAGPGWNWQQPWGGDPSWQSIALYGGQPLGLDSKNDSELSAVAADMSQTSLCRYLSADGRTLLDTPQDIWRMPTTDELVRSLVHHGENAGCTWQGEFARMVQCAQQPDKESPLWATDVPVIYYWAAGAYNADRAYFVAYNGTVNATNKRGGNPRHGYRCVREP